MEILQQVREDAGLRERMVAAGQETVKRHTWEAASQQMEQVLGELGRMTNHEVLKK